MTSCSFRMPAVESSNDACENIYSKTLFCGVLIMFTRWVVTVPVSVLK